MKNVYSYTEAAHYFESTQQARAVRVVERSFVSKPPELLDNSVDAEDLALTENQIFTYRIFKASADKKNPKGFIFLFHGLNERSWQKYYPWAENLCLQTGRDVVLFPLAFHMERSPQIFKKRNALFELYKKRNTSEDNPKEASFFNAFLSERLQKKPERFFTSGYQTYEDVRSLVQQIRSARHPDFEANAPFDIFAYSIGAFFAEILLMCNPDQLFTDTRLFNFCGGSVLETTNPLSKSILDTKGVQAVFNFFRGFMGKPEQMSFAQHFNPGVQSRELFYFSSMLSLDQMQTERETRLDSIGSRIKGISLHKDRVIPPDGVYKTLGNRVREEDFPFAYTHEAPFPLLKNEASAVDASFSDVFGEAAAFLG